MRLILEGESNAFGFFLLVG